MNKFLGSRDYSPVRYCAKGSWCDASERTKREHIRKIKQGVSAIIETIAPGQEDEVRAHMSRTGVLDSHFNCSSTMTETDQSLNALAAAYRASEERATKVQILSIIVDTFPQKHVRSDVSSRSFQVSANSS